MTKQSLPRGDGGAGAGQLHKVGCDREVPENPGQTQFCVLFIFC